MNLFDSDKHRLSSTHSRTGLLRVLLVSLAASCCMALVGATFWYEDVRYSLPTPRPPGLHQPEIGSLLPVREWLSTMALTPGRPTLLHFFNPACSCSKFNLEHLRELEAEFGDRVAIVAVVQSASESGAARARLNALGLTFPYVQDRDGRIAAAVGVYSTPQGALFDGHSRLVYRGNYNVSRYCSDRRTEFVRVAIENLLGTEEEGGTAAELSAAGSLQDTAAYGCELPSANRVAFTQERGRP